MRYRLEEGAHLSISIVSETGRIRPEGCLSPCCTSLQHRNLYHWFSPHALCSNEPSSPVPVLCFLIFYCNTGVPVFIITWVVARFTFFLNPTNRRIRSAVCRVGNVQEMGLPCHDMLTSDLEPWMDGGGWMARAALITIIYNIVGSGDCCTLPSCYPVHSCLPITIAPRMPGNAGRTILPGPYLTFRHLMPQTSVGRAKVLLGIPSSIKASLFITYLVIQSKSHYEWSTQGVQISQKLSVNLRLHDRLLLLFCFLSSPP